MYVFSSGKCLIWILLLLDELQEILHNNNVVMQYANLLPFTLSVI